MGTGWGGGDDKEGGGPAMSVYLLCLFPSWWGTVGVAVPLPCHFLRPVYHSHCPVVNGGKEIGGFY